MKSKERASSAWLIEAPDYIRTELHGFEVDMSGRVVVPEFHPCAPVPYARLSHSNWNYELRLMSRLNRFHVVPGEYFFDR